MMELGENSVETLMREFHEETDIDIEPIKLLNVYTNAQVTFPNGDLAQTVGFLYEVRAVSSYPINDFSNDETLALGFFSEEEIEQLPLFNEQQKCMISEYFSGNYQLGN